MDLRDFGGFPVVVGVVQVFKASFPTAPPYAATLAALVASELWGIGVAMVFKTDLLTAVLIGVVVWLMAMGAWSGGKTVVESMKS